MFTNNKWDSNLEMEFPFFPLPHPCLTFEKVKKKLYAILSKFELKHIQLLLLLLFTINK